MRARSGTGGCSPARPGSRCPPGVPITLTEDQLPHHFKDDGPHPLKGVDILVAGSAGEGFIRHMARWGAQVLLTGEADPAAALQKILADRATPDTRFDVETTLCKLRDLLSRTGRRSLAVSEDLP